jgi:membrane fusion protein (multidrug efflux system)
MKRILLTILSLFVLICFTSCFKKQEATKNIEQLQKENGIPVRISQIVQKPYVQVLTYNAPLSGIEESTAKSMVGDVILNVNGKVGDYVKKDQIIISFSQDTPSAQYEQANSAYLNAQQTYNRMQRLFNQGAISQQEMDNVTTAYNVTKANLNSSSQMINVKAPISGYITAMKVSQGDNVSPGTELFTISNTSKYKAVIWVPDSEIQYVKKGQKVSAQWGSQTLSGATSTIALAMDQDKKAFRTEIIFNTHPKQIISGITFEIKLEVARINSAIVIERKSITEENNKMYVWLEVDNKAVKTEIKTQHNNGIEFEVISGLKPGDELITEGISLLTDNCLVQIIK